MVNETKSISKAIVEVMKAVNGVEKNIVVGSGNFTYNGVSDKDVKDVFKPALTAAGLSILPINIEDTVQVDRWEETYNGNVKSKQSIFTTVKVKYLLLHTSGESIELMGYGHGADTMDKAAGKATTYALKNCLLYTFLTPVGAMDDTDSTHSEEIKKPQLAKKAKKQKASEVAIDKLIEKINNGEADVLKKATDLMDLEQSQINSLMDAQLFHDESTKEPKTKHK